MDDPTSPPTDVPPVCPLCGSADLIKAHRLDGEVVWLTCQKCRHVSYLPTAEALARILAHG
jgi:hypothetical protein